MEHCFYGVLLLLTLACPAWCQKRYLVHDQSQFDQAVAKAAPGDSVVIANGTYTPWSVRINNGGDQKRPVVITAQTKGQVVFTGKVAQPLFNVKASHVTISGLTFRECELDKANGRSGMLIQMDSVRQSRVTDCSFERNMAKMQFMPLVLIGGNSEAARIDHCTFEANIDNQDVQVKVTKEVSPQHTLIDHNTFLNKKRVHWANDNGGECVQVGQDPILLGNMVSNTMVTHNRFIACSAEPEVISNKSSKNTYQANYFEDCNAELVMRGGHDCVIDSNRFKGGMGIRINGSGHTITRNQFNNVATAIRLNYGMAKGRTETGFYVAATDCRITDNTINNAETGILIGGQKNEDWTGKFDTKRYPSRTMQDVPPGNNKVKNNHFTNTKDQIVEQ
ncbi:hypothetical protein LLH06_06740 [Mucilaginibacter daejeonensis]|uniref:chondroitinase-B domain-containing protein n=1 Tax=Mucilaginibacter daejeonensis TaxID=398049 RepID=UPI001D170597|nr:chondroitinase-B domain-containing protein [Mucilaginibacter daejeonensis]UEG54656.1 hypothetical protein LLH06_06740 [Mucilaginibacter daejeonensis]